MPRDRSIQHLRRLIRVQLMLAAAVAVLAFVFDVSPLVFVIIGAVVIHALWSLRNVRRKANTTQ